jgi:hypothetical protein
MQARRAGISGGIDRLSIRAKRSALCQRSENLSLSAKSPQCQLFTTRDVAELMLGLKRVSMTCTLLKSVSTLIGTR